MVLSKKLIFLVLVFILILQGCSSSNAVQNRSGLMNDPNKASILVFGATRPFDESLEVAEAALHPVRIIAAKPFHFRGGLVLTVKAAHSEELAEGFQRLPKAFGEFNVEYNQWTTLALPD